MRRVSWRGNFVMFSEEPPVAISNPPYRMSSFLKPPKETLGWDKSVKVTVYQFQSYMTWVPYRLCHGDRCFRWNKSKMACYNVLLAILLRIFSSITNKLFFYLHSKRYKDPSKVTRSWSFVSRFVSGRKDKVFMFLLDDLQAILLVSSIRSHKRRKSAQNNARFTDLAWIIMPSNTV